MNEGKNKLTFIDLFVESIEMIEDLHFLLQEILLKNVQK